MFSHAKNNASYPLSLLHHILHPPIADVPKMPDVRESDASCPSPASPSKALLCHWSVTAHTRSQSTRGLLRLPKKSEPGLSVHLFLSIRGQPNVLS